MKALVAVGALLAFAAPAGAAAPPPSYERFDGDTPASPLFRVSASPGTVAINTRPPDQNQFLQTLRQPTLRLTFARPQASVELLATTINGSAPLVATAHTATNTVTDTITPQAAKFEPIVLAAPNGAATITSVDLSAPGLDVGIDDVAISEVPQPDTTLVAAPDASTPATTAAFGLESNVRAAFRCSLDGAAFGGCGPFGGLLVRGHTLAAAAVDDYGAVDSTPARYAWTVVPPAPDTIAAVEGASAVFSGAPSFQCSVDGGAWEPCRSPFRPGGAAHKVRVRAVGPDGQVDDSPADLDLPADADHDDIPDDQERLPLALKGPQVGQQSVAQADSGTVLVRLPGAKAFVPFAGRASLPVGSVVDTIKGQVTLEVASNGYAKTDRRHRDATVTLSAGIFQIRQARMRKGVTSVVQIPVELVLRSPPGAEAQCRRRSSIKGVVRTLTAGGKGVFRVTGAASRADTRNGSFATTDRCDGTLTQVTKGSAKVRAARRTIAVRQGRRYFARARLFSAKKSRARA